MANDNKNSFFFVRVIPNFDTAYHPNVEKMVVRTEDQFEPVLSRLNASQETYIIYNKTDFKSIIFLFKTISRKRESLLRNTIKKHFPNPETNVRFKTEMEKDKFILENSYRPAIDEIKALTKTEFITLFKTYTNSEKLKIKGNVISDDTYVGSDLSIFENRASWYDWQNSFYDMIYNPRGKIKEPDDRSIVYVEQKIGSVGKSKFLKYLYKKDPANIGLIREGTSAQLNSALYKMMSNGSKKIIFIDLPRTNDCNYSGLANVMESCKNGIIVSHMYGANESLLFAPPHLILVGNRLPSEAHFSVDRWVIYEISNSKNKAWKNVTKSRVKDLEEYISVTNKIKDLDLPRKKAELRRLQKLVGKR